MKKNVLARHGERGGAGVKLLLVLSALALAGNALINYVPVAYNGENFKQEMQTAVVQGMVVPPSIGSPIDVTKKRLKAVAIRNQLPNDTFIDVRVQNSILSARVAYSQRVSILPFGIYDYVYTFDHTATPTGFFTKETD